jgi:DNA invertase Pin-like site-specific DNA recombinase
MQNNNSLYFLEILPKENQMNYGYVRISSKKQDTDKQGYELLRYAFDKKLELTDIIYETVSGRKSYKKRKLGTVINKLAKDDSIVVTELSRFGRSLLEIMEILNVIMKKEAKIFVTKGNLELGENIQSKVLAFAFGLASEIERELISSRTKEALAKLKAEGKHIGRPKGSLSKSKLDGKQEEIYYYLRKGISITSICKLMDISPSAFYNFCRSRKIDLKRYKE